MQWEDFNNESAFHILEKYADVVPSFNDDIQGTGSVSLGGVLSACDTVPGVAPIQDQVFLFQGAGEAGTGIAELIAYAVAQRTGKSIAEARRKIWLVDSKGLVTAARMAAEGKKFAHHKIPFAHQWDGPDCKDDLAAIVNAVKPSAIIGVRGHIVGCTVASSAPLQYMHSMLHTVDVTAFVPTDLLIHRCQPNPGLSPSPCCVQWQL